MTSISWFFSFCHYYSNLVKMIAIFTHQRLYEIHQQFFIFSHQCHWFIQNEQKRQFQVTQTRWKAQIEQVVTQTFQVCKLSIQQVANQARIAKKQQRVEQTRLAKKTKKARLKKKRLKVFACKRYFIKFFNNIKFHEHIKNHYAKKFKSILFILFTLFTSLVVFTFFVVFNMLSQTSFISFSTFFTILFALFFAISFSISKKLYLMMNNLFVIFFEKFKWIDLLYRSRNSFSSLDKQLNNRKFFISQTRITFYFLFVTFKKSKKLNSIRQSSFVAKKLIDVERFNLNRVFSFFSILFWISRIRDHFL